MRTHLEFESDAFPPTSEEQLGEVNPGRWGHRLASYLRDELVASGFVAGEPFAEDWGWVVSLENPSFPLWIGCGNQDGEGRFLCFISPDKPVVRRWFRKVETTARVERVAAAMDAALIKHPSTRELRWWTPSGR